MKLKNHLITCLLCFVGFSTFAQYSSQKKADNLFNKFSFVSASKIYQELIEKNYNADNWQIVMRF